MYVINIEKHDYNIMEMFVFIISYLTQDSMVPSDDQGMGIEVRL